MRRARPVLAPAALALATLLGGVGIGIGIGVGVGVGVGAAPASAASSTFTSFQTPTKNIGCIYFTEGGVGTLRCDVLASDAPVPPRPADCDLDWGNAFSMTERGRAGRICAGDSAAGTGPVVAYGTQWKRGGFTCTSATTGLTCKNRAGRGWTLTRKAQKLF